MWFKDTTILKSQSKWIKVNRVYSAAVSSLSCISLCLNRGACLWIKIWKGIWMKENKNKNKNKCIFIECDHLMTFILSILWPVYKMLHYCGATVTVRPVSHDSVYRSSCNDFNQELIMSHTQRLLNHINWLIKCQGRLGTRVTIWSLGIWWRSESNSR